MRKAPLQETDLSISKKFLIASFHYDANGEKRRFILPRLVTGDSVYGEVSKLAKEHNIFRLNLYHSNFPHIDEIFGHIMMVHESWTDRLFDFEKRVPYLVQSTLNLQELEEMQ